MARATCHGVSGGVRSPQQAKRKRKRINKKNWGFGFWGGRTTPYLWVSQYKAGRSKTMGSFLSAQTKPTNPKPAAPLFVYMSLSFSIPSLNLMHLLISTFSFSLLWHLYLQKVQEGCFIVLGSSICDNWIPIFRILALWSLDSFIFWVFFKLIYSIVGVWFHFYFPKCFTQPVGGDNFFTGFLFFCLRKRIIFDRWNQIV